MLFHSKLNLRCMGRRGMLGVVLMTGFACAPDIAAPRSSGTAYVRVINTLFQDDAGTVTPVAIDHLIDSATTRPSVFDIPVSTVSPGDSANGYQDVAAGIHGFVARRAGDTVMFSSVYTTTSDLPYLPRQFLQGETYYTMVVAGIIPATGNIPNNTIPFSVLVDDPFPGPEFSNALQARFRVINAAPYTSAAGTGATATIYVTPGATVPAGNITQYASLGTAAYRNASAYINVDPGVYTITLRASNVIVAQQAVTFVAGEVRTLVVQSTAAGAPGTANHVLTNLLDHQYGS